MCEKVGCERNVGVCGKVVRVRVVCVKKLRLFVTSEQIDVHFL